MSFRAGLDQLIADRTQEQNEERELAQKRQAEVAAERAKMSDLVAPLQKEVNASKQQLMTQGFDVDAEEYPLGGLRITLRPCGNAQAEGEWILIHGTPSNVSVKKKLRNLCEGADIRLVTSSELAKEIENAVLDFMKEVLG